MKEEEERRMKEEYERRMREEEERRVKDDVGWPTHDVGWKRTQCDKASEGSKEWREDQGRWIGCRGAGGDGYETTRTMRGTCSSRGASNPQSERSAEEVWGRDVTPPYEGCLSPPSPSPPPPPRSPPHPRESTGRTQTQHLLDTIESLKAELAAQKQRADNLTAIYAVERTYRTTATQTDPGSMVCRSLYLKVLKEVRNIRAAPPSASSTSSAE
eukprot:Sspe_Gene.99758::Locus_73586_Transcript_1_1_Confidence_1.000_Length_715::g.99758::m.99758